MDINLWFALASICLLGAMSPGPSLALIIKNTVSGGSRQGLLTALGHGMGVSIYALITIMGLGLVISQTYWLFRAIQYAGAAFLLYKAIKILLQSSRQQKAMESEPARFSGFAGGFLVTFLNPKMALFFLALFSQFLSMEQSSIDQLIMVATAGGIDIAWYVLIVMGIGGSGLLAILERNGIWVDRLTAVIFILLAVFVLIQ